MCYFEIVTERCYWTCYEKVGLLLVFIVKITANLLNFILPYFHINVRKDGIFIFSVLAMK